MTLLLLLSVVNKRVGFSLKGVVLGADGGWVVWRERERAEQIKIICFYAKLKRMPNEEELQSPSQ